MLISHDTSLVIPTEDLSPTEGSAVRTNQDTLPRCGTHLTRNPMNLLIDNNNGLGPQDYTSYIDGDRLPQISRKLNQPAVMTATLVAADPKFECPVLGARIILQRSDGYALFTGYLTTSPEQEYLGYGQVPAWRFILIATDDSCLLDHNELPARTPFASRTAGNALATLASDALPGGLDESGVEDVSTVNQYVVIPQKGWTCNAQELALMSRAAYRAHDSKLDFQPVGQASVTISDQDPNYDPAALILLQPDKLLNDLTIVGEMEPLNYVRDFFLGNGTTLDFYLSETPFVKTAVTVFEDHYSEPQLAPTLWDVTDPNDAVSLSAGQLQLNSGPSTITFVEQLELAGGLILQHGEFVFNAASTGIVGGIYNGSPSDANCIAGFTITPNGPNSNIQALINGSATGPVLTTTSGHQYAFATQLICSEAHRVQQTYLSSLHPAGNGHGGDSIPAAVRVVLTVHDVDPSNPGTLATVATILYDDVLPTPPGFATYALINTTSFFAGTSYTRVQHIVDAEVRSMIPGGQFRTRLAGAFADGGECYITSSGTLCFYAPYPPQLNEQIVVSYRSSARAIARVQDPVSIAEHASESDKGQRRYLRKLKLPPAPTSVDCENAATALLDDSVLQAWQGEYKIVSDFLPVEDVLPGNVVQISAPSRGADFTAVVRQVELQVVSLVDDRSSYDIKFANDACDPLALKFDTVALPEPSGTVYDLGTPSSSPLIDSLSAARIYDTGTPSSSLYIDPLTAAQVTNVIATEITIDAGVAPPAGGGIEVRRSDGGWGPGDSDNLAGRFTTQQFTVPRLERVQGYYLRQYDGSSPAKYSRYSALLHVDYPL